MTPTPTPEGEPRQDAVLKPCRESSFEAIARTPSMQAALSPAPEAGEEGERRSELEQVLDLLSCAETYHRADGEALDYQIVAHGLPNRAAKLLREFAALSSTRSTGGEVDGPEMALEDAKNYGVGFIVDGMRVSPSRVTICHGDLTSPQPARPSRETLIRLRDWIAREVPVGTESATWWLTELDRALHPTDPATRSEGEGE